jgi:hypothetical protein
MTPHPYVYEKLMASRHAQIQHEMQKSRMLAHMGKRRTFVRSIVARLGSVMIVLGSYLQRTEQGKRESFRPS